MNGILNYAAPARGSKRDATFATLSTCSASLIFLLPPVMTTVTMLLQREINKPGPSFQFANIGMLVVVVPSLAMLAFPLLGLLFAAASVATGRFVYTTGLIGLIISCGGLIAAVLTILS